MWSPPRLTVSTAASLPLRKPNIAKARARGIAARHPLIDAVREPGDLQLEIALIAPEPGKRVIGLRLAGQAARDAAWPDRSRSAPISSRSCASKAARAESGAIADRRNRGIGGHELRVDDDAVGAGEPGLQRERVLGGDADADDDEIGGQTAAIDSSTAVERPFVAMQRRDAVAQFERRAERPCASRKKADMTGEMARPIGRSAISTTVTFAAEAERRRGDLQADEAGADHDDAPRAWPSAVLDRRGVADRAQAHRRLRDRGRARSTRARAPVARIR